MRVCCGIILSFCCYVILSFVVASFCRHILASCIIVSSSSFIIAIAFGCLVIPFVVSSFCYFVSLSSRHFVVSSHGHLLSRCLMACRCTLHCFILLSGCLSIPLVISLFQSRRCPIASCCCRAAFVSGLWWIAVTCPSSLFVL